MTLANLRCLAFVAASAFATTSATAANVVVSVDGQAMPWYFIGGGINDSYQYGVLDGVGPTVVSSADGFDFAAGGVFTITYLDGFTSPWGGDPIYDANGDPGYAANDTPGSSGNYFPSLYVEPSSYPANLNALIGTFTDATGQVVGTPFLIGNLGSFAAPVGAAQLQLGFNDDIFWDNTGSLRVEVMGPSLTLVPEPSTLALSGLSVLAALSYRVRRRGLA